MWMNDWSGAATRKRSPCERSCRPTMDRQNGARPSIASMLDIMLTARIAEHRRPRRLGKPLTTMTTHRKRSLCYSLGPDAGVSAKIPPAQYDADGGNARAPFLGGYTAGPLARDGFNAEMRLSNRATAPPNLPSSCSARQETFLPARRNSAA